MTTNSAPVWVRRLIGWTVSFFIIGVLLLPLLPPFEMSRGESRRTQCKNNLKQLLLALHNYHDAYDSFPPAYVVDADGKRMHSWRTLILPHIESNSHLAEYRWDEPWDSAHNREVTEAADMNPWFIRCPADENSSETPESHRTSYLAVVGPDTAWPGAESVSLNMVTDGASNTIMLVEVVDSGIDVFEPRDLSFEELSFLLNDPDRPSPSSRHQSKTTWPWQSPERIVNVALVDGSVKVLPQSMPPETLKALLTINGGEATEGY